MKPEGVFTNYILLPLVTIIFAAVLVVLNKKNEALSNKALIVFILLCGLILAVPGLFTFAGTFFMPGFYIATQLIFLCLGYLYSKKTESFFSTGNDINDKSMSLLCTVLILCLGSYLFSLIFNKLGSLQYGFMASTCTFTLALPMLFRWTYHALLDIPTEIYKLWKYNPNYQEPTFTSETLERITILEIELRKNPEDSDFINVKAKAPLDFTFDEWFQMFIHDYNVKYCDNIIQYCDEDGELYNWMFYLKPSLLKNKRFIDYDKTIEENGLAKAPCTIVCKRVNSKQH
ncbi:TssN family type VI secretion system protein [Cytophagaceae bacterium ABcell3]|nr:TssN family type VI secretion system protein [Cytophagaceae bacterium ABcell3]